jgi:hypothetical protein
MFELHNSENEIEANRILNTGNEMFKYLLEFHKNQRDKFWLKNGITRSKEELQAICDVMDSVRTGQSAEAFNFGAMIVEILLMIEPTCLQPEEYTSPYPFTIVNGCVLFT